MASIHEPRVDKVLEKEMARLIGTTLVALRRKRHKGIIPPTVYATIDGRITYSIRRYDEWVESQWNCQPASSLSGSPSVSASCGTESADAKPCHTRKPRRVSKQPPVLELR